jgi:hypothetical protein
MRPDTLPPRLDGSYRQIASRRLIAATMCSTVQTRAGRALCIRNLCSQHFLPPASSGYFKVPACLGG